MKPYSFSSVWLLHRPAEGSFGEDALGKLEIFAHLPHLRFVELADGFDVGRLVAEAREIAKVVFGFVFGAKHEAGVFFRQVVEVDHAHARHDIAASRVVDVRYLLYDGIHGGLYVDDFRIFIGDAQLRGELPGVPGRLFAQCSIGQHDGDDVFRSDGMHAQCA